MIIAFHDLWKTALLITIGKRWDFVFGPVLSVQVRKADVSEVVEWQLLGATAVSIATFRTLRSFLPPARAGGFKQKRVADHRY
jgi:hypothetical protein